MAILAPHFDLPFKFGAVCEQGSQRDLANCVFAVVVCPKGFREEVPGFGTVDPAFDNPPVMTDDMRNSIAEQEPRAEILFEIVYNFLPPYKILSASRYFT